MIVTRDSERIPHSNTAVACMLNRDTSLIYASGKPMMGDEMRPFVLQAIWLREIGTRASLWGLISVIEEDVL